MSNKLKNIIKGNLDKLLNEDVSKTIRKAGSVSDNSSDDSVGRADFIIDKIKDNLATMGVRPSDIDHIKTMEQLMVAPFGIDFTIRGEKNKWGETINKDISTRCKYDKGLSGQGKTIVLKTKDGLIIKFDSKEIITNLSGTKVKVPSLVEGRAYNVSLNGNLDSVGLDDDSQIYELKIVRLKLVGDSTKDKQQVKSILTNKLGVIKINDQGNWFKDNTVDAINGEIKKGVRVRKSEKDSDTIVVSWTNRLIIDDNDTQAILVKGSNIWDELLGNGLSDKPVSFGRKMAGNDEFTEDTKGTITLEKKR
jgi:hypothetical protein